MNYQKLACEKLDKENKAKATDRKATAIQPSVLNALKAFCEQDMEFAQAVYEKDKTLVDCVSDIAKGIGNSISDLEVYKKAVGFYFEGATVEFNMMIKTNPYEEKSKPKSTVLNISLDDLLDD